jgi:acetyl-CoA acetyltransferase
MRRVAMVGAGMTPFAEHFALGIKDLIPMAYAECVAGVDKGVKKSDIQAAWFGELSTTDGFPSGILADTRHSAWQHPPAPIPRTTHANLPLHSCADWCR